MTPFCSRCDPIAMHSKSTHPILLVHPDADEAEYLRTRLTAEGVPQPIVLFADTTAVRDYLAAVMIVEPVEKRHRPCVVLLDEKVGEAEVHAFTLWLRAQPSLESIHVVVLFSNDSVRSQIGARSGVDETVAANRGLHTLTAVISRACD